MHQQRYRQQAITDALGLTQGAVSQIIARARVSSVEALQDHKPQGARPRLTTDQKADSVTTLYQNAAVYGYQGDVWTCTRIAQLVEKEFGVHYHPDQIGSLLRQIGWGVHRPLVRATQRDEAAIAQSVESDLSAHKKAQSEERTLLTLDESAFYLLPGVVATWAPADETPVPHCKLTRDHPSLISAISLEGQL
jgi:transposase